MDKIKIVNLSEGEHRFEFKPDCNELDLGDINCRDLVVTTVLRKTGSQIVLDATIEGKFLIPCDRCLDDYEHAFESRFEIVYKFDDTGVQVDSDDNIRFISSRTAFIDIREDLRDYLLLAVPMKAVPPEINGKCSVCGRGIEDLLPHAEGSEINPVWEKLIKLKKKEK